jgi:DNA polymerase elongation subunit (family B)
LAEEKGFEIVHGIVDSLWLKKEGAYSREYIQLCGEIEREIGVPVGFEGRYRWIVFLPSKTHASVPVLNRYYGVFENGKIKVRGIEARRRDTPKFIRNAQIDMIKVLAKARDSKQFLSKIPEALEILKVYTEELLNREVSLEDLLITKQLSMAPYDYAHNIFQAIAAMQLVRAGLDISAGQAIRFLITDACSDKPDGRVKVAELIENNTNYDVKKYMELLLEAGANILRPFGYSFQKLYDIVIANQKQLHLSAR